MAYEAHLSVHVFLRQHERDLPKMSRLVRKVLYNTPSSAPSERACSLAGHVAGHVLITKDLFKAWIGKQHPNS